MSNSFDNKIKDSVENFEMPYDANAWAEFEKQLPKSGGAANNSGQLGAKVLALLTVLSVTVATLWYLNSNKETTSPEVVVIEQSISNEQQSLEQEVSIEQLQSIVAEETKIVSTSEKREIDLSTQTPVTVSEATSEVKTQESERLVKSDDSKSAIEDKNTPKSTEKLKPLNTTPKPLTAEFIPTSEKVCVGETVSFINQSSNLKAKMAWDFGDGTTSIEADPSHSFVLPGNYTVVLTTAEENKRAEKSITITVNPSPATAIDASQKLEGYDAIPFFHFETILQQNETATWKFSDGSSAKEATADHLFREAGKFSAFLTVKNNLGCSATDKWEGENRQAFELIAPTGFTPDGDGLNETFIPGALPDMGVAFEMIILDQKGQRVFSTSNPLDPWNGRLNNSGEKLNAGIYVWTVVLNEEIVRNKTFRGTIKLDR